MQNNIITSLPLGQPNSVLTVIGKSPAYYTITGRRVGGRSTIRHKVGYCDYCGWTHTNIKQILVEDGEKLITKAICDTCRGKKKREVVCKLCGNKSGTKLNFTTVEKRRFEGNNTCNIIVALCDKCRNALEQNRLKLIEQLNLGDEVCDKCKDRFKCYTSGNER